MNLEDLTPAGGGALRSPVAPRVSEPVATFTRTEAPHPDLVWSPRGGELAPQDRPLSQPVSYEAPSERPTERVSMGFDVAHHIVAGRQIRAAMRLGSIGG